MAIFKSVFSFLKKEKTIIDQSGYLLLADIIGTIVSFTSNFFLSLVLGPAGFGTLKTVASFFENFPVRMGFNTTLIKYLPELEAQNSLGKIKCLLKSFLKIRLIIVLITAVIFFLLRRQLSLWLLGTCTYNNLICAGIILFIVAFSDLFRPCVIGFRNYRLYVNINFLISTLRNVLALALALIWGITGAIFGLSLGIIPGLGLCLKFLFQKKIFSVQKEKIDTWQIIKHYSLPTYFVNLTGLAGSLIVPLLALFYKQEIIGYYSFAMMISSNIALISGAIGQIFFPEVALEHFKNGASGSLRKLKRVLVLFLLACIIIIPLGIGISKPLILRYSPAYSSAIPIVRSLFLIYCLIGALSLVTAYYTAVGENKVAAMVSLFSSVVLFSLSFWILKLVK